LFSFFCQHSTGTVTGGRYIEIERGTTIQFCLGHRLVQQRPWVASVLGEIFVLHVLALVAGVLLTSLDPEYKMTPFNQMNFQEEKKNILYS